MKYFSNEELVKAMGLIAHTMRNPIEYHRSMDGQGDQCCKLCGGSDCDPEDVWGHLDHVVHKDGCGIDIINALKEGDKQ